MTQPVELPDSLLQFNYANGDGRQTGMIDVFEAMLAIGESSQQSRQDAVLKLSAWLESKGHVMSFGQASALLLHVFAAFKEFKKKLPD